MRIICENGCVCVRACVCVCVIRCLFTQCGVGAGGGGGGGGWEGYMQVIIGMIIRTIHVWVGVHN